MYALKLTAKGWHGVIADTFTFKNLSLIAEVYAAYLKEQKGHRVVIAYDRRFNHHLFAQHLADELGRRQIDVSLSSGPVPSSVLRLAIRGQKVDGGVMFSASQLPDAYGGLQIYDRGGEILARECYQELNTRLQTLELTEKSKHSPKRVKLIELKNSYFETLKSFLDLSILRGIKGRVIHNALSGAMAGWLKQFVAQTELKIVVQEMNHSPMGDDHLHDFILQDNVDDLLFYLNTNSDGSKLGLCLPEGISLNRHQVSHIILDYLHRLETEKGFQLFDAKQASNELKWLETEAGFKATMNALVTGDLISNDRQLSTEKIWQLNLLREDALACTLMLLQIQATELMPLVKLLASYEDTDWRQSFGMDKVKLKTKRLPRRFMQEIPEVLANHKVLSVAKNEHLKLTFDDKAWLEFRLDREGEKSSLLLRCQAKTSKDVKNLLSAAKVLVHTIART
jgi:phosphomannomutase